MRSINATCVSSMNYFQETTISIGVNTSWMTPSPEKWSCPPKMFSQLSPKRLLFSKKLLNDKIFETSFPLKKFIFINPHFYGPKYRSSDALPAPEIFVFSLFSAVFSVCLKEVWYWRSFHFPLSHSLGLASAPIHLFTTTPFPAVHSNPMNLKSDCRNERLVQIYVRRLWCRENPSISVSRYDNTLSSGIFQRLGWEFQILRNGSRKRHSGWYRLINYAREYVVWYAYYSVCIVYTTPIFLFFTYFIFLNGRNRRCGYVELNELVVLFFEMEKKKRKIFKRRY